MAVMFTHTHTRKHTHTCTHTRAHTHRRAHTHTHTHTYTGAEWLAMMHAKDVEVYDGSWFDYPEWEAYGLCYTSKDQGKRMHSIFTTKRIHSIFTTKRI